MSTLRLTTISNQSGSASVPSDTVINGSAKAWVNFQGTGTVAIRQAFNVSSITDNGVGDYRVNFSTSMPDANYCTQVTAQEGIVDGGDWARCASVDFHLTTGVTVFTFDMRDSVATAQLQDVEGVHVTVFR